MSADRAVFLDRDGVLNELVLNGSTGDHESPYRPEDVSLTATAVEALRLLRSHGIGVAVISNQPSAAKGTADLASLQAVHDAIMARLEDEGLAPDDVRYCFHHPMGSDPELGRACDCRKPAPGLIFQAADALGLDAAALGRSWLIGDSDVDIEAAHAAGLRAVLVEEPLSAHRRGGTRADERARDVLEAARIVAAAPPNHGEDGG